MAGVLPGAVRQVGYVVNDLDDALAHWTGTLGVGPWFKIPNLVLDDCDYRGQTVSTEISFAIANSGEMQFELIQPQGDTPSCYSEFLAEGTAGPHHMAWWTEDFDATLERATRQGWEQIQSGDAMGTRFCYFDGAQRGALAELMELNDMSRWLADHTRDAALSWDGLSDPVRAVGL